MTTARVGLVLLMLSVAGGLAWKMRQTDADAKAREAHLLRRLSVLESGARQDRAEPLPFFARGGEAQPLSLSAAASAAAAPTAEPTDAPVPRSSEEMGVAYANEFEDEPIDEGWASGAERSMGHEINARLPNGSELSSFKCRSRFCRLEVVHDSIDVANATMMSLFSLAQQGPFSLTDQGFRQGEPVPTPDGKLLFTVYVGRPGVSMTLIE
jgi:hypothetical protein